MGRIVWTQDWEQQLAQRVSEKIESFRETEGEQDSIVKAWVRVAHELASELYTREEAISHLIGLHKETGYGSVEDFLQRTLGPNPKSPKGNWEY